MRFEMLFFNTFLTKSFQECLEHANQIHESDEKEANACDGKEVSVFFRSCRFDFGLVSPVLPFISSTLFTLLSTFPFYF